MIVSNSTRQKMLRVGWGDVACRVGSDQRFRMISFIRLCESREDEYRTRKRMVTSAWLEFIRIRGFILGCDRGFVAKDDERVS